MATPLSQLAKDSKINRKKNRIAKRHVLRIQFLFWITGLQFKIPCEFNILVDVSDICYLFLLGEGDGESKAPGRGGVCDFLLKIPGGGRSPGRIGAGGGRGVRKVVAGNGGGG